MLDRAGEREEEIISYGDTHLDSQNQTAGTSIVHQRQP